MDTNTHPTDPAPVWLESLGECSRYWIGGEESAWRCDYCGEPNDPREGACCNCYTVPDTGDVD